MSSNYQLAMKLNSIFRFPVLPEEIEVSYGSDNSNLKVYGVGECTIIQDSALRTLAFRAFSRRLISADAITATFRIRTQQ